MTDSHESNGHAGTAAVGDGTPMAVVPMLDVRQRVNMLPLPVAGHIREQAEALAMFSGTLREHRRALWEHERRLTLANARPEEPIPFERVETLHRAIHHARRRGVEAGEALAHQERKAPQQDHE